MTRRIREFVGLSRPHCLTILLGTSFVRKILNVTFTGIDNPTSSEIFLDGAGFCTRFKNHHLHWNHRLDYLIRLTPKSGYLDSRWQQGPCINVSEDGAAQRARRCRCVAGASGVCARVRSGELVALLAHPNRFQPPGLRSQRSRDNLLRPKPRHVQSKMSSWHSYRLEPRL